MTGFAKPVALDELDQLFDQVNNWGRWGAGDQKGALNLITPNKRRSAAALVQDGTTVSAALPLATEPGPDNAYPVTHLMVRDGDMDGASGSADYVAIRPHGMANTHLDALCHIFYKGRMYNGRLSSQVTAAGAEANSIEACQEGIVSRGVLLDLPRLKGADWLEPGEAIYVEDLESAEAQAGLSVEEGDILIVSTGRDKRRSTLGAWNPAEGLAGLHATCLPWLHERGVAVLGCDGVSDVMPSGLEGVLPIHVVGLVGMGLHLIDNCGLADLAAACAQRRRWEFLLVVAPLRLLRGTASPVNPVAVF